MPVAQPLSSPDSLSGQEARSGRPSARGSHTNGIESFWALLKRGYQCTFHKLSPKHLRRYCDELAGRQGSRNMDTIVMMPEAVTRMVGKSLTYRELIVCIRRRPQG